MTHTDFIRSIIICLLLAVIGMEQSFAHSDSEAALKTAFLYNFLKLIKWPDAAEDKTAYHVCIAGNDELGAPLNVLEDKTIRGKPIVLHRPVKQNALTTCHLVFITSLETMSAIISKLNNHPVLTISGQAGFIEHGGMIGLVHDGRDRLTYEVNLDKSQACGLHLSAPLLKLAHRIISKTVP